MKLKKKFFLSNKNKNYILSLTPSHNQIIFNILILIFFANLQKIVINLQFLFTNLRNFTNFSLEKDISPQSW